MGKNTGVKVETRNIEVFICTRCGTEYRSKASAELCESMGAEIDRLKKIVKKGRVFCIDGSFDSVDEIVIKPADSCRDMRLTVHYACSNGKYEAGQSSGKWSSARSITIAQAVKKGWKVAFRRSWNERATKEMKAEYLRAIRKLVGAMPKKRQKALAVEHLAFCKD